jgi:hypothetical protein
MLEEEFPGKAAIEKQLETCLVRQIDDDGSLEFQVGSDVIAEVKYRVPVEGRAADEDGVMVHYLLHVLGGQAKELEIYREDSAPIKRAPRVGDIQVLIPG